MLWKLVNKFLVAGRAAGKGEACDDELRVLWSLMFFCGSVDREGDSLLFGSQAGGLYVLILYTIVNTLWLY